MLTVRTRPVGTPDELLKRCAGELSPELYGYASSPADKKARAERMAAYLLLADTYRTLTGDPLPPVLRTPEGKPYLSGSPLSVSLSHTEGMVAVAVSDGEVGVDIERICRHSEARRARLSRFLSPAEQAAIASAEDPVRAFVVAWVRKEAQVKKRGIGLAGMRAADATTTPRYEETVEDGYYLAVY